MSPHPADSGVRLAEMMAALSKATDLGMGQPVDTALRSCVVAMRLGEALSLDEATMRDVFYQALLRYIGCNAETQQLAALVGDELALRHDFATVDTGRPPDVAALVVRYIREANVAETDARRDEIVARSLLALPQLTHDSFAGHCEVAQRLATRMGLPPSLVVCLGQLYERWDGRGQPHGLSGEDVSPAVRVVTLAQDAAIWARAGGVGAAVATVRERAGGAYDPHMAERLCASADALLGGIDAEPTWEAVLALEPGPHRRLTDAELDAACAAAADFADIKSPWLLGHSAGVAALAAGAGRRAGLSDAEVVAVHRAGLLHDVGRAGVSAGIWGKEGPLSPREWEKVRLHAYHTDRVLAEPAALAHLGAIASHHHERCDGSGYHRGTRGATLTPSMRILAAADAYQAMTEARPHRPALRPDEARRELLAEVAARRLDGDAAGAVLAEAGHEVPRRRRDRPAGLSEREVEVLRLVCRGLSNKEMAGQLHLAADTVKHHIQHIYDKTGLSTRAGATLFAMENALL